MQIVLRRINHTQCATAHQINIVRMVSIQIGHNMCSICYIKRHIHLETCQLWSFYDGLGTVTEVGKLNQFIQLVISCQRAVTKHVTHISRTQHIETATHIHIIQSTTNTGKEVDESLAIGYTLLILLGIDNLIVLGPQTHICHDMIKISKVNTTMNVQFVILR